MCDDMSGADDYPDEPDEPYETEQGHEWSDEPTWPTQQHECKYGAHVDIGRLGSVERWGVIAEGFTLLRSVVRQLSAEYQACSEETNEFARKLLSIWTNEEAAKIAILFDYVRTPDRRSELQARQLKYFNDHVPKQIYAEHFCWLDGADFGSCARRIESAAAKYEVDGDYGVSWSFPNRTEELRHELYVGLWRTWTKGAEEPELGETLHWHDPFARVGMNILPFTPPQHKLLDVIEVLHGHGLLKEEALPKVRSYWEDFNPQDDYADEDLVKLNIEMFRECGTEVSDERVGWDIGYPFWLLQDLSPGGRRKRNENPGSEQDLVQES